VAPAARGIFVFRSMHSGGKASVEEHLEIKKDGTMKYNKKVVYMAVSGEMGKLLEWLRLQCLDDSLPAD
jgi:hypothetical protein